MIPFQRADIERPSSNPTIKETTQARLDALQRDLDKSKSEDEKRRIREEILSIKRELNRTKQYTNIMDSKHAEGKNNLDSISAANLMKIDKESKDRR